MSIELKQGNRREPGDPIHNAMAKQMECYIDAIPAGTPTNVVIGAAAGFFRASINGGISREHRLATYDEACAFHREILMKEIAEESN